MDIELLLEYVRKTNKEMTLEKLKEELNKCRYSTMSLMLDRMEMLERKNYTECPF